jgi:transposase
MATKRLKPEEIVVKLRQVEVLMGQGMPRIDAIRQIGVTEQTYYRWKKMCGGYSAHSSATRVREEPQNTWRMGR